MSLSLPTAFRCSAVDLRSCQEAPRSGGDALMQCLMAGRLSFLPSCHSAVSSHLFMSNSCLQLYSARTDSFHLGTPLSLAVSPSTQLGAKLFQRVSLHFLTTLWTLWAKDRILVFFPFDNSFAHRDLGNVMEAGADQGSEHRGTEYILKPHFLALFVYFPSWL